MGCHQTKMTPYQVKAFAQNKRNQKIQQVSNHDQEKVNHQFYQNKDNQIKLQVYVHNKKVNYVQRLLGGSNKIRDQQYRTLVQQYNDFVQEIRNNTENIQPFPNFGINDIKYQNKLLSYAQQGFRIVLTKYVQFQKICYRVYISQFQITINIRVLNRESMIDCTKAMYKGGFGQIHLLNNSLDNCKACLKILRFSHHKGFSYFFLQNIIRQVAISKLASSCEIGPRFFSFFHQSQKQFYDLILFTDAICYKMQYCTPISEKIECSFWQEDSQKFRINLYQQIDRQLSSALVFLHKLKLVHRDIKTSNILYNQRSKSFLFCDFGLSHAVKQSSLDRSLVTQLGGTRGYMYPELQRLFYLVNDEKKRSVNNIIQTTHYANLYINDLFALKKTLYIIYQKLQNLAQQVNNQTIFKLDPCVLSFQSNQKILEKQYQLRLLRMIYGFNHFIQQKWNYFINSITDQQKSSVESFRLQKYKTKFLRILENNLENTMQIEMLQKNRGLNYNFFTFQEFINIGNQILEHNMNSVNLLRIIIAVLKSLKNIPSYELTYQNLVDLNQQKNVQNYSNKIFLTCYFQDKPEINIKNSILYLLANEQQPDSIKYFWQPNIEKQENSKYNQVFRLLLYLYIHKNSNQQSIKIKVRIVLESLKKFCGNRRTILFMDQLAIQTSSESFGEIFVQASIKMKKMYYAKNREESILLEQPYQEAISKKNVDLYQEIAMLYTQSAYQCCNKDSQKALNYCDIATQILQHIKRVTNQKQAHYSCSGILLLIRHILQFRQRKNINIKQIKQTQTLIKLMYGESSIYHFQILFLKQYYQNSQKNYQQIFKNLFRVSKFDYNFLQYSKIQQHTTKIYSQLNSQKKGLEQIHFLIMKQLKIINKIISSKATLEEDQKFLSNLKTNNRAKLFKQFISIILPRFNLFDLSKDENIVMLQHNYNNDLQNLKSNVSPYKRFILNNAMFLNKKNKIYRQISETTTQVSISIKKQISNQTHLTRPNYSIQVVSNSELNNKIISGVEVPSASTLSSFNLMTQIPNINCIQIKQYEEEIQNIN